MTLELIKRFCVETIRYELENARLCNWDAPVRPVKPDSLVAVEAEMEAAIQAEKSGKDAQNSSSERSEIESHQSLSEILRSHILDLRACAQAFRVSEFGDEFKNTADRMLESADDLEAALERVSTERVCPHLHQDFPGTELNQCLDCGVRLGDCCVDWKPECAKLNAPLSLAQARNPHLTATPEFQFKPWLFCPWCGTRRTEPASKESCYCVCHNPASSCPWCKHCKGEISPNDLVAAERD